MAASPAAPVCPSQVAPAGEAAGIFVWVCCADCVCVPVTLLQACVELPEMDADPASVLVGFNAAYGWSDFLWKGVFSKLPAAKAAKTEGSGDFKLTMQALVAGEQQQRLTD